MCYLTVNNFCAQAIKSRAAWMKTLPPPRSRYIKAIWFYFVFIRPKGLSRWWSFEYQWCWEIINVVIVFLSCLGWVYFECYVYQSNGSMHELHFNPSIDAKESTGCAVHKAYPCWIEINKHNRSYGNKFICSQVERAPLRSTCGIRERARIKQKPSGHKYVALLMLKVLNNIHDPNNSQYPL